MSRDIRQTTGEIGIKFCMARLGITSTKTGIYIF